MMVGMVLVRNQSSINHVFTFLLFCYISISAALYMLPSKAKVQALSNTLGLYWIKKS